MILPQQNAAILPPPPLFSLLFLPLQVGGVGMVGVGGRFLDADHHPPPLPCRGCVKCIPRCVECGRCLPPQVGSNQVICFCHVCDDCEVALPQCARCEHRSCWAHVEDEAYLRSSDKWFVCKMCVFVEGETGEGEGEDWGCP